MFILATYVQGLKKNLISNSCLEGKGYIVVVDGEVFVWPKGSSIM